MPASRDNFYQFVTEWRVAGKCGEVADVFSDPLDLPRWWPAVYLAVDELRPPDANGLGRRVRVRSKGWLPYELRWDYEVTDLPYPHGLTIVATGDFDGRGIWTFEQDGAFVLAILDWRIRAEKPLIRNLSWMLRPVFEANHVWAMARGRESLELELVRRRALTEDARQAVPPPPGPVTYAAVGLVAGAVVVGGTLAYLMNRARKS